MPSPCEVQVPLGSNRAADARSESLFRMAHPISSRSPSVVAQSTDCGGSVMPLLRLCCVHRCHLLPILVTPPVMSSASVVGSGPTRPSALVNHRAHRPTAGDGRWGSRERERGCSRRWSDQPSRRRLRRRQASPCRRASCCRRLSWPPCTRSLGGGVTRDGGRLRARGDPARRSSSARAALAGRDGAGKRGVRCRAPVEGSMDGPAIRSGYGVPGASTLRRYTVLPSIPEGGGARMPL
jgi:hypothetical protein